MVIAITTGVLLAAVLFMREMAEMTKVTDITSGKRVNEEGLPAGWRVFKINGPLFFAAADRIFGELAELSRNVRGIICIWMALLYWMLAACLPSNSLIATCQNDGTRIGR